MELKWFTKTLANKEIFFLMHFFTSVFEPISLGVLGVPSPPLKSDENSNGKFGGCICTDFEFFNTERPTTPTKASPPTPPTFRPDTISETQVRNEFTFGLDTLNFVGNEIRKSVQCVADDEWSNMLGMNSSYYLRTSREDSSNILFSSKKTFNNGLPVREIQKSFLRDDYNVFTLENGKCKSKFTTTTATISSAPSSAVVVNPFNDSVKLILTLTNGNVLFLDDSMKKREEFMAPSEVFIWGPSACCVISILQKRKEILLRDIRRPMDSIVTCSKDNPHKQIASTQPLLYSTFITNDHETIRLYDLRLPSKPVWNIESSFLGWTNCPITKIIPYSKTYQFLIGNSGNSLMIICTSGCVDDESFIQQRPFEDLSTRHSIRFLSKCTGCHVNDNDGSISFGLECGLYSFTGIDDLLSLKEIGIGIEPSISFSESGLRKKKEKITTIRLSSDLVLDSDDDYCNGNGYNNDDDNNDDSNIFTNRRTKDKNPNTTSTITHKTASQCLLKRW